MAKARSRKLQTQREIRPAFDLVAKTENQAVLMESIENFPLVVTLGPAGAGKTYVTAMLASQALLRGDVNQIILTRANVPTGRTLGHFPGTIEEKLQPWLAPSLNVLKKALGAGDYDCRLGKSILTQPLETIRGQSFDDSFIIIDESQNLTIEELKALTTRIGENCTMVLCGDPNQSDVKDGNDLLYFVRLCNDSGIEVPIIQFGISDIVRSDIVGQLVRMFYEKGI